MTRPWLLLSGLLAAMGGCASHDSNVLDGPIDYQLTTGFSGHQTTMHIELDGRTTRTTADGSTQAGVLDPATIDDLRAKIVDAEFATLPATIGCQGCADGYVYTVSVVLDRNVHSVAADQLAPWPDNLKVVIDTLTQIASAPLGS